MMSLLSCCCCCYCVFVVLKPSSDPHIGTGVICGGLGGGLQQTQEPLSQSRPRRRRHADRPLPAAQDWNGGM